MYRKQVRRRRGVLVLLVVACLMLISISISEADDGPLHSIQEGASSILNPIGEGASRALKPARDLVNWFDETLDARGENDELKADVAELRTELLDTQDAAEEAGYADRLGQILEQDDLAAYEPVDSGLIFRSPSAWYGTIKIDAGGDEGIAMNDAVVTADGLIGRVSDVGGGWSWVTLLTDSRSSVTARVSGKGPVGSIEAVVGAPGRLDFGLIQGDGEVTDGDELVTAGFSAEEGLGSLFPGGVPIGRVDETIPSEQELQQTIRIEPYADLDDLNEVTVLTGGPEA